MIDVFARTIAIGHDHDNSTHKFDTKIEEN